MHLIRLTLSILLFFGLFSYGISETRITYKSAKSTSSYYQMAVEIAEAMKKGSDGAVIITIEEIFLSL